MESRYVDWWEAFKGDEWDCLGRQVMEEKKGLWSEDNPEGLEGDDYIPIYNFWQIRKRKAKSGRG